MKISLLVALALVALVMVDASMETRLSKMTTTAEAKTADADDLRCSACQVFVDEFTDVLNRKSSALRRLATSDNGNRLGRHMSRLVDKMCKDMHTASSIVEKPDGTRAYVRGVKHVAGRDARKAAQDKRLAESGGAQVDGLKKRTIGKMWQANCANLVTAHGEKLVNTFSNTVKQAAVDNSPMNVPNVPKAAALNQICSQFCENDQSVVNAVVDAEKKETERVAKGEPEPMYESSLGTYDARDRKGRKQHPAERRQEREARRVEHEAAREARIAEINAEKEEKMSGRAKASKERHAEMEAKWKEHRANQRAEMEARRSEKIAAARH